MERVQLHLENGVRRVLRWRSAGSASTRCRFVTIGQMADGRWFADHSREPDSLVCRDQAHAEHVTAEWMAAGRWWRTPAEFDAAAQPIGDGWRLVGSEWILDGEEA